MNCTRGPDTSSPFPHDTCVHNGCQWSQYVCTDAALQELVANLHCLTPSVRTAIMDLAWRG